jgi:HEAT repeat protein
LATLGDQSIVELLRARLRQEKDHGLRVAYAASLGQLQDTAVTPYILSLLYHESDPMAQAELALALARLLDSETKYVQMLRQIRLDMDTAASQIILSMTKKSPANSELITETAVAFSRGHHRQAFTRLIQLANDALEEQHAPPYKMIRQECLLRLPQFGPSRQEYLLLTLVILTA